MTKDGNAYASGTASTFSFTPNDNASYVVTLTQPNGALSNLITNGGFESGAASWNESSSEIINTTGGSATAHSGTHKASRQAVARSRLGEP